MLSEEVGNASFGICTSVNSDTDILLSIRLYFLLNIIAD